MPAFFQAASASCTIIFHNTDNPVSCMPLSVQSIANQQQEQNDQTDINYIHLFLFIILNSFFFGNRSLLRKTTESGKYFKKRETYSFYNFFFILQLKYTFSKTD
jgi:hypothetical protein